LAKHAQSLEIEQQVPQFWRPWLRDASIVQRSLANFVFVTCPVVEAS